MASAEDYAKWIVQNQDKQGTPEFDTVSKAYRMARGGAQTSTSPDPSQGPQTMRQSIAKELESRPMWERALAGVGGAVEDAAMRLKQLTGQTLTPQEVSQVQAYRDIVSQDGAALTGNIGGNLAMTAAPGAALARGATVLAGRAAPAVLAPTIGAAATGGAISGLTQPVLEGESTAGNIGLGMAGGAIGDATIRSAARVAQPIIQSDAVKTLLRSGIVPTPGQAAGKNSWFGRGEQAIQSVPLVGNVIRGGRNRAGVEFNEAAINQAVPAGQPVVKNIGKTGIEQMQDAADANFARILAGKEVVPDETLAASILSARQSGMLPLDEAGAKQFDALIKKHVWDKVPFRNMQPASAGTGVAVQGAGTSQGGSVPFMPADKMKSEIIGDLGKVAQTYLRSSTAAEKAVGMALMEARNAAQKWLMKAANLSPKDMAVADAAYSAQMAVESAGRKAVAKDSQFTPYQLMKSSRPNTASGRLAAAAQEVLPDTVPNSGTADRAMLASVLGIGATGIGSYFGSPGYLAALAAAPAMYSRTGSRYMIGDLIPGQNRLAELLRQASPYGAPAGANTLLNMQGQ